MKKIFLSFADKRLYRAAKRIHKQATDMAAYDRVIVANEDNLDADFKEKYRSKMIPGSRGFGYWCWKPQIILQTLRVIENGDILQWTDVGCHINAGGKKRLLEYFQICADTQSDILAFQGRAPEPPLNYDGRYLPDVTECKWTKGDLFDYFDIGLDTRFSLSPQIGTTTFFVKKSSASVELIQAWQNTYSTNFAYADDSPSVSPNSTGFIEHRHDQSIFSLLCKIKGVTSISAFEYWYPKPCPQGTSIVSMVPDWEALKNYPIHAKRDKDRGVINSIICSVKKNTVRAMKNFSKSNMQ